jgi:hypothetical protein
VAMRVRSSIVIKKSEVAWTLLSKGESLVDVFYVVLHANSDAVRC